MSDTSLRFAIARLALKLGVQNDLSTTSDHGWLSVFETCLSEIDCLLEIEGRHIEQQYALEYAESEASATPESMYYGGSYVDPMLEAQ